jgi:hypothetical protein
MEPRQEMTRYNQLAGFKSVGEVEPREANRVELANETDRFGLRIAANALLRLTPGPAAFPWQTHARGLAGHLAFGVVADTPLDVAEAVV